MNPAQQAGADLQAGRITYDQYQQALAAYNAQPGAPAGAPAPKEAPAPPYVPPEPGFNPAPLPEPQGLTPNEADRKAVAAGDAANAKLEAKARADLRQERGLDVERPPISAPPTPQAPGQLPGVDPRAALLQGFAAPRPVVGGPARPVGFSPADKDMLGQLGEQARATEQVTRDAVTQNQQAVDAFTQQSQSLADDSRIGLLTYQQQVKDNAARRAQIEADAKTAQDRINAQLAEEQAKGVDPDHYWHQMGTGGRIGMAIAMGLGAWGAALSKSPNYVAQMVSENIQRDVDAQRANLANALELTKTRASVSNASFDQQLALLESERDSIQTGYTLASNEVAKQMATNKDNLEAQQRGAALQQQLAQAQTDKVGALNEKIYGLRKGAERVVGGGGGGADVAKQQEALRTRVKELRDKGVPLQQAFVEAGQELGLMPIAPGEQGPDFGPKAAGGDSKAASAVANVDTAIGAIDSLIDLRSKAGVIRGGEAYARGKALSVEARARVAATFEHLPKSLVGQLTELVPEDPLERSPSELVGKDPTMARLQTARSMLQQRKQSLLANPGASVDTSPGPEEKDEE